MSMSHLFRRGILGVALAAAASCASAAFIDFIEGPLETDPVTVLTDLLLTTITVTPETATVTGFHTPGISPSPVAPGSRSAGLFEDPGFTILSDYVLFTAGQIITHPTLGTAQAITALFFSEDIPLSQLATLHPGFPFGGGVLEDGTLQGISSFLNTLPEGVIVRIQSDAAPEPASLLLFVAAILGLAAVRRKVA